MAGVTGASLDEQAVSALVDYAGVDKPRAELLIAAAKAVAGEDALQTVTGEATVYGSLSDTRVERLRRIVAHLDAHSSEAPPAVPSAFELAALWRITEGQAKAVLRIWRARHPEIYERRMAEAVSEGDVEAGGGEGSRKTWVISYADPDVLAYAETLARRSGLSKGLKVDRSALTISAPQDVASHAGQDLKKVLRIK